jgi:hypothetical protein
VDNQGALSTERDFTWTAWVKTREGGAIIAQTGEEEREDGAKCLHLTEEGFLGFSCFFQDLFSDKKVNNGEWTFIALTADIDETGYDEITFYIDGETAGRFKINLDKFPGAGLSIRIGYCNREFPDNSGFTGIIDEVRWFDYALGPGHINKIYRADSEEE